MSFINVRLNLFLNDNIAKDINYEIGRYVQENMAQVSRMSSAELAAACHVSQASISRFCRMIGYEDFKEFKKDCIQLRYALRDMHENARLYPAHPTPPDAPSPIPLMEEQAVEAVRGSAAHLDLNQIDRLCQDIHSHKQIYFAGILNSGVICRHLQMELTLFQKSCYTISDFSLSYLPTENVKGALLVMLSGQQRFFQQLDEEDLTKFLNSVDKSWLVTSLSAQESHPMAAQFSQVARYYTLPGNHLQNRYALLFWVDVLLNRYASLYGPDDQGSRGDAGFR